MVVSDAELEALHGLPWGSRLLYLVELRPRMDYTSGEVGRIHRVSWDGMRQALEVEPRAGIKGEKPSRDQVRRMAQHLVRAGLVVLISDMVGKQLIMRLPLAISDFCGSKKAARKPPVAGIDEAARKPTGVESSNGAGFGDVVDDEAARKPPVAGIEEAATHPLSVDRDEMDARAGEAAGDGGGPTGVGDSAGCGSAVAADAGFRQLLGADGAATAAVMSACVRVAAVCRQREVTALEMKTAIGESRRRKVSNVAGYAASIIESGSLVAPASGKVVPFGRGVGKSAGGIGSVLAAAREAMGYGD